MRGVSPAKPVKPAKPRKRATRNKSKPVQNEHGYDLALHGPYYQFSTPYGKATLQRDVWYLVRRLPEDCRTTEMQKLTGETSLGCVLRFRSNKRRYVIDQQGSVTAFSSLGKALQWCMDTYTKEQQKEKQ